MQRIIAALICTSIGVSAAAGAVEYTAVNIGRAYPGDVLGYEINSAGHVTGTAETGGSYGFYYNGSTNVAMGDSVGASGINDLDQVVCTSGPGFIYQNGVQTFFPGTTDLTDINNSGQMTGALSNGNGFFYSGGSFQDLGAGFNPRRVNESGHVLGNTSPADQAFIYFNNAFMMLGQIFGYDLNNLNQVLGKSSDGHAVIYDNGTITDLGLIGPNDSTWGINDAGTIVGKINNLAAVYRNGSWTYLNDLVAPAPDVSYFDATDINNSGQIIVHATSYLGPSGAYDTYILTPVVPEPAGLALVSLFVALMRRRRPMATVSNNRP